MKTSRLGLTLFAFFLFSFAHADEGMWLLNHPPRQKLQEKYGFDLTDPWLLNVQRAAVRLGSGGSGGFVSPDGLVVTNHHVGADSILKLSTKARDLYRDGFLARTRVEELKCPDLEINVLHTIEDVTDTIRAAVAPNLGPTEALAARRAIFAQITKDSEAKTGLRSDIVTLYQGGRYHLYRYQKYTDVRLVMSPEFAIAFFGGEPDNYEYPRYNLDVCFFRVYENGKPIKSEHYFRWSAEGPKEDDLVFVAGHPGSTNRLETLAHLKHRRDVTFPYLLAMLRQREALLTQYAERGPDQKRNAQKDLFYLANSRKAYVGQYQGLLDSTLLAGKAKNEVTLRNSSTKTADSPWERIESVQRKLADFERLYLLLEKGDAFDCRPFRIARHLVRLAEELPKEDTKRLGEYRSSAIASLKFQLFSPAPISLELERLKLAGSLAFLAENLGGEHPLVVKILAGKSPEQRAEEMIVGTKLHEVPERQRLFDAGLTGINASSDPLIHLVCEIDREARELRQRHDELDEQRQQAYADLTRILFDRHGTSIPPDATFSLRLAFGVVKGYREEGRTLPFATTFGSMFRRAEEQGYHEPCDLPKRWLERQAKLDPTTPFNFVSTSDTINGNSGSPVLNRAGELVGINFDRNRHGLIRNFLYTDVQARHISVHSQAVLEALRKIYDADVLAEELHPTK